MRTYPKTLPGNELGTLNLIAEIRREDIINWKNLSEKLLKTSKAHRIPKNSKDISPSDREGDRSFDDSYKYELMKMGNDLYWNRTRLDIYW